MSNDIRLHSFPDSDHQALAYLYTKNQDLRGKSAKEIAEIYYSAYYEITYCTKDIRINARKKFKSNED